MDKKYLLVMPDGKSRAYSAEEFASPNIQKWLETTPSDKYSVYEQSPIGDNDEELEGDMYNIRLVKGNTAKERRYSSADWHKENVQNWIKEHPEAEVSRIRPYDYWGERAKTQQNELNEFERANGNFMAEYEARQAELADDSIPQERRTKVNEYVQENARAYDKLKAELDTYRQAYDNNPAVIAERNDYRNQTVDDLKRQMAVNEARWDELGKQDMAAQYDPNNKTARRRLWLNRLALGMNPAAASMAEQPGMMNVTSQLTGNAEAEANYRAANQLLDESVKLYGATKKEDFDNLAWYQKAAKGVTSFGKAAKDRITDKEFWESTLDPVSNDYAIGRLHTKVTDLIGSYKNISEADMVKLLDDNLTDSEQALLEAYLRNAQAMQDNPDTHWTYTAGGSFADSMRFMAEFMLGSGATGAATKGATKGMLKWFAKRAGQASTKLGRAAIKGAGKLAVGETRALVGGAIQTAAAPSTYANIASKMSEINDAGQLNSLMESVGDGLFDAYIENASEFGLGLTNKALSAGKKGLAKAIGHTRWGSLYSPAVGRMMERAGIQSGVEEWGEELNGAYIRSLAALISGGKIGDEKEWDNFWSKDNQLVLLASFAPTIGGGTAISEAQRRHLSNQMSKKKGEVLDYLTAHGYDDDSASAFVNAIGGDTPYDLINNASPYLKTFFQDNHDENAIRLVLDYISTTARALEADSRNAIDQRDNRQHERELVSGSMQNHTEFTMPRYTPNGEAQVESVRRIQMDDKTGYMVGGDEQGWAINYDDGSVGILSEEQIQNDVAAGTAVDTGWMTADDFLDMHAIENKNTAEQMRMESEQRTNLAELQDALRPGSTINIGTTEAPLEGVVSSWTADGAIIEGPEGFREYTWEELARITDRQYQPKTDVELAADEAARLDRFADARAQMDETAAKGYASIQRDGITYNITAALGWQEREDGQQMHVYATDADGNMQELWLNDNEVAQVLAEGDIAMQRDVQQRVTENVQEETPHDIYHDFRGNPLPMTAEGQVDEAALWNNDPEAWARWNDEQKKDNGTDSNEYINAAIGKLQQDADALMAQRKTELDFVKRNAIDAQLTDIAGRVSTLRDVLERHNQPATAGNNAVTQRIADWQQKLGVKINSYSALDEIPDERVRKEMQSGRVHTAWYDPKTDTVNFFLPNIADAKMVDSAVLHEVIAHQGLKHLLGNEYNTLLDRVYNELMNEQAQRKYVSLVRSTASKPLSDQQAQRMAADEFIAYMAQDMDLSTEESQTLWQRLCEFVKDILDRLNVGTDITIDDLRELLQASMTNYIQQNSQQQQSVLDRIPTTTDKKGGTTYNWEGAPDAATALAGLRELGYEDSLIRQFAKNRAEKLREEKKRLEKRNPATIEELKAVNDQLKENTRIHKFWNDVVALMNTEESQQEKRRKEVITTDTTGLPGITERFNAGKRLQGVSTTRTLAGGLNIKGHFELVESGAVTPSHNPETFKPTEGYPTNENGSSINDRDYEHDEAAQQSVRQKAGIYDQRAYQEPVIVSREGVVLSGNDRTMAGMIAADNGTDTQYVESLMQDAPMYGFTDEQVKLYAHPRLVFVLDEDMPYTTETMAMFNANERKTQNKTEQMVKSGKAVKETTFTKIADVVSRFDNISDMYRDETAAAELMKVLLADGVINQQDVEQLMDNGALSRAGQEYVESLIMGYLFNGRETTVRRLMAEGMGNVRRSIVGSLASLTANRTLGEYSLQGIMEDAIAICYEAHKGFGGNVGDYLRQRNLFESDNTESYLYLAKWFAIYLNSGSLEVRAVLDIYNRSYANSAGIEDVFGGRTAQDAIKEITAYIQNRYNDEIQGRTAENGNTADQRSQLEGSPENRTGNQTGVAGTEQGGPVRDSDAQNGTAVTPTDREWAAVKLIEAGADARLPELMSDEEIAEFTDEYEYWEQFNDELGQLYIDLDNDLKSTDKAIKTAAQRRIDTQQALVVRRFKPIEDMVRNLMAKYNLSEEEFVEETPENPEDEIVTDKLEQAPQYEEGASEKEIQATKFTKEEWEQFVYGGSYITYKSERTGEYLEPVYIDDAHYPIYGDHRVFVWRWKTSEYKDRVENQATSDYVVKYLKANRFRATETKYVKNQYGFWTNEGHNGCSNPLFVRLPSVKKSQYASSSYIDYYRDDDGLWNISGSADYEMGGGSLSMSRHLFNTKSDALRAAIVALENFRKEHPGNHYNLKDVDNLIEHLKTKVLPLAMKEDGEIDVVPDTLAVQGELFTFDNRAGKQPKKGKAKTKKETKKPTAKKAAPKKIVQADEGEDETAPAYGSQNTIITADKYEELKRKMRDKLNNLNAGFDPEVFFIGAQMAAFHVEAGARKFVDFAKRMIEDLGDAIRPYLKSIYNGARDLPGMEPYRDDMDSAADVDAIDVNAITLDEQAAEPVEETQEEVTEEEETETETEPEQQAEDELAVHEGDLVVLKKKPQGFDGALKVVGRNTDGTYNLEYNPTGFLPVTMMNVDADDFIPFVRNHREDISQQRREVEAQQPQESAPAAEQTTGRTVGEIGTYTHTKTGREMSIVRLTGDRLSADEFKELKARAKELGGYYSSYGGAKGFLFDTVEDATKFNNLEYETEQTDEQTATDTAAIVSQAASVAEQAQSIAQTEEPADTQRAAELITQIDEQLQKVNDHLALLGFYQADKSDPSKFHESYGFMKSAEKKAVKDADRLAKELAKDLGIEVGKKQLAQANIAPAGGDITFRLPLMDGFELYVNIDIAPVDYTTSYGYSDDLRLGGVMGDAMAIMYRIENPTASGQSRYVSSNMYESIGVMYNDFLKDIRRAAKAYLPEQVETPAEDNTQIAQTQQEKPAKSGKSKKKEVNSQNSGDSLMGDLFADIYHVEDEQEENEPAPQDAAVNAPAKEVVTELNGYKIGDRVLYTDYTGKTQEATIYEFDGGRPVLDSGFAPVMYELVEWDNIKPIDNGLEGNDAVRTQGLPADNTQPAEGEGGSAASVPETDGQEAGGADRGGESGGQSGEQPGRSVRRVPRLSGQNKRNNHVSKGEVVYPKTPAARFKANIAAIRLLKELQTEGKQATKEQMAVLRQFTGWGGLGGYFNNSYSEENRELRSLLTGDEFDAAQLSINTAYYTPTEIIDTLWDVAAKLGFQGGKILEGSAGIGNILASIPKGMNEASQITAVELDNITGGILEQLYPDAQVYICGFETVDIDNASVDLAITNVPFGENLKIYDAKEKDLTRLFGSKIHDFCIAKNIRKLRPGGVGIFISSRGTLDSSSRKLRQWIVNEGGCDVLGAFRLNNETFVGTKATADIIVVRKRVNNQVSPDAIDVTGTEVVRSEEYETGETEYNRKEHRFEPVIGRATMEMNTYFTQHPEFMGGEMAFGFEKGNTYRAGSAALYPSDKIDQAKRLKKWVSQMKESEPMEVTPAAMTAEALEDTQGVKEGQLIVNSKGEICQSRRGKAVPVPWINDNKVKGKHTKAQVLADYDALKAAIKETLDYQLKNESDEGLQPLLKKLNRVYDDFVKKYGYLTRNTSISFLKNDVEYSATEQVEIYKEKKGMDGKVTADVKKAQLFYVRQLNAPVIPTPETVQDGVIVSMNQFGRINIPFIAQAMNLSEDKVREDILAAGVGFEDPASGEVVIEYEYLSGNVREKLEYANEYNTDGRYDNNIKALQNVIPADIPAHLIEFSLGSDWLPVSLYVGYAHEKFGVNDRFQPIKVGGSWTLKEDSIYYLDGKNEQNRSAGVTSNALNMTVYGHELMLAAMNNKTIEFVKTETVGGEKETRRDKEATAAATTKMNELRDDFKEWARQKMQSDEELAAQVSKIYNELFNSMVPKQIRDIYVPEHFNGMANVLANGKPLSLRPHQARAVIRSTTEPVILAHEVGTGKTFTLITAAMEMRRLGTAKKPMIVVQNATLGQFVSSAKELYPSARILTISEQDRTVEGRGAFYAKIRYNDWDLIIVPQSVFEMMPDSEERRRAFIQSKIEEKESILSQADQTADQNVIRRLQQEIEDLRYEYETGEKPTKGKKKDSKRQAESINNTKVKAQRQLDRRTDDVSNFDEMGIDALLIDEAHAYKHLGFASAMQRGVKGVDASGSKRAAGVFLKTRSIFDRVGWKNVVFATGTPISNTAAEIWTFMKYLLPDDFMWKNHIYYFDDFVRNFGSIQQNLEFTTSGKFKETTRFAAYTNLPELVRVWMTIADVVLTKEAVAGDGETLNDKVPRMEDWTDEKGEKHENQVRDIYLPQSASLITIMAAVRAELERFENMSGKEKQENSHIPLVMFGTAKAAAIDTRLVSADSPDEPQSKTNRAVEETLKALEDSKRYKGTCALFCDTYRRWDYEGGRRVEGFNVFDEIRRKLIARGVPADQIIIMESGMSTAAKEKIFAKVNNGEIRVIMGTTATLGTGVNIQERLFFEAHLDAPNRPMDYTQRMGRILRQGNLHKEWGIPVRVIRFGVEDSLDVTAYQRLSTKSKFINSVMDSKHLLQNGMEDRVLEEEEEGEFDNPVAILSGSEYALLKTQAERELRKLQNKKEQHRQDQIYIENKLKRNNTQLGLAESNQAKYQQALDNTVKAFPDGIVKEISVEGVKCKDDKAVAAAVKAKIQDPISAIIADLRRLHDEHHEERHTYTITFDGVKANVIVNLVSTYGYDFNKGEFNTKVSSQLQFECDECGFTEPVDMPGGYTAAKDIVEYFKLNVANGGRMRHNLELLSEYIDRLKKDNELMLARKGKPFADEDKLKEQTKLVEDLTEKMKVELAAKEAKYAEELKKNTSSFVLHTDLADEDINSDDDSILSYQTVTGNATQILDYYENPDSIYSYMSDEGLVSAVEMSDVLMDDERVRDLVGEYRRLDAIDREEGRRDFTGGEMQDLVEFELVPLLREIAEQEQRYEQEQEPQVMFQTVTDPVTIAKLEAGDKIRVYRAMQEIDGKLYPPMAARVDGKMVEPVELGKWEQAVERPELADAYGRYKLDKGNGKSLKARYNPYIHTSRSPLNDQFTSAYDRPNLVTVEVEVPESELTSGYKAQNAKDSVGEIDWHSGPVSSKLPKEKSRKVILTRWDKPIRVVPDSEVAQKIAQLLEGEDIAIPYNTVTPSLRYELEQLGVKISGQPSGNVRGAKKVLTDNQVKMLSYVTGMSEDEIRTLNDESAGLSAENAIFASNNRTNERGTDDIQRQTGRTADSNAGRRADAVRRSGDSQTSVPSEQSTDDIVKPLRKLKPGETCLVERKLSEAGEFSFIGRDRIESTEDVAFIFRKLETKAVENSFIVFVKDGKPTVLHVGMGNIDAVNVDLSGLSVMMKEIEPDQVYFVHNHPSGNIISSAKDRKLWALMQTVLGKKLMPGIIIDTTRGVYGTYMNEYDTSMPEDFTGREGDVKIPTYRFDEVVFSKDYEPVRGEKVSTSRDVAAYVSSHRLGERDKISVLCINTNNLVVGNFFLPYTGMNDIKTINKIAVDCAYYAGITNARAVVVYGSGVDPRTDNRLDALAPRVIGSFLNAHGTTLLDMVGGKTVPEDNGLYNYYSYRDHGRISEPDMEYGSNSDDDIRYQTVEPTDYEGSAADLTERCRAVGANLGVPVQVINEPFNGTISFYEGGTLTINIGALNGQSELSAALMAMIQKMTLSEILGDEAVRGFAQECYRVLPEFRQKVVEIAQQQYGWNTAQAMMQYLGSMAESEADDDESVLAWNTIWVAFDNMLDRVFADKAPMGMQFISTNELRYILFQNAHHGDNSIATIARGAALAHRQGVSAADNENRADGAQAAREQEVQERTAESAANLYNRVVSRMWSRMDETYRDQFQSVNTLVDALEKASGKKAQGFEDIRKQLNQQSSKGLAAMQKWEREHWDKMMKAVQAIIDERGLSYDEVERYLMLKHGIERNDILAKRDARAYYQAIFDAKVASIQEYAKQHPDMTEQEIEQRISRERDKLDKHFVAIESGTDSKYKEQREKDYGGLTGLYSKYENINPYDPTTETQEEYEKRLLAARKPMFDNMADTELAADAEIADFEKRIGSDLMTELWNQINGATKAVLKHQYDANMMSRSQYEHVRDMFKYYVPLRGFAETTPEDMYSYYTSNADATFVAPLKQAKGRKTRAESPLAYIGAMASSAIAADIKNESKLALYYFVSNRQKDNDLVLVSDVWYLKQVDEEGNALLDEQGRTIFEPQYPPFTEALSTDQAKAEYEQWENEMKQLAREHRAFRGVREIEKQRLNYVVNTTKQQVKSHIIVFKLGGRDMFMFINGNPRAAQAINGELNVDASKNEFTKATLKFLRAFASLNTSLNPEFWLSNLQRDTLFALMSVNVKEDKAYNEAFRKNLKQALKVVRMKRDLQQGKLGDSELEQHYRMFVENGGVTGYTSVRGTDVWEAEIKKYTGDTRTAIERAGTALDAVQEFGESFEQLTRFAAYLTSREQGKSVVESVADAKELTVNFNRKGSGKGITWKESEFLRTKEGRKLNDMERLFAVSASMLSVYGRHAIMFFNASVQGLNAMYLLAKKDKSKLGLWVGGYLMLGAMNAVLHAMLDGDGDDDDQYLDVPDYERRNNLLLGLKGAYLKWALPQEARVFYGMGDMIVNHSLGREPHRNIVGEVASMIGEIAPLDATSGLAAVTPSITTPIVEVIQNEDYKGARVYNDNRFLSDEEKKHIPAYRNPLKNTSKVYLALSEALNWISGGNKYEAGAVNWNPNIMEHIVEGYTGGVGTTVGKGLKFMENALGGEVKISDTPFLRRLMTWNDDRYRNAHVTDLYYYYREVAQDTERRLKEAVKAGDEKYYKKVTGSYDYKVLEVWKRYEKEMDAYDKYLRLIDAKDRKQRKQVTREHDALRSRMIRDISNLK